ncbi:MaoC family dehydratase N-terminal domain-containing protein [Bacillus sp. FJAT-47783]|uniref:MaoC family dehydratase N-terminal domain-containing protein n=1 Tax=Bacillus sp. FJAT-47783 TaxID=2922712 RepID=UPI001FAD0152|nr:MaoC family dehydratase N-terminal domain-containing protein [Bacillus sp. FJAT-47783]
MTTLNQKVGFTFEPFTFSIERGKIKEFALAIGDPNPIYYDIKNAKEEGYRDIPVPPTFATCIEMWEGADFDTLIKALELNPLKVLHGEQTYEYLDCMYAGDVIQGKTSVVKVETKRNLKLVTLQTDYFNQHGKKVLIATSTVIER